MDDASPTLLLTRPDAQSRAFLAECEASLGARIPAVVAPLIRIIDIGELPDLDQYEMLIVTSAHAVWRLAEVGALRGRQVACVGEVTAALARQQGASANALGADAADFLAEARQLKSPCLYVRGMHVRVDLVAELAERGVTAQEAIVYDQIAQPLGRAGEALLEGVAEVVAPLFSARTAELLGRSSDIRAPMRVIAMSEGVAAAWGGGGMVEIVSEPTSAAMCAAVVRRY